MEAGLLALIGAFVGSWFGYLRHRQDLAAKMIELSIGLLAEKPDPKADAGAKALRSWAIDTLAHFSEQVKVPLTPGAKSELRDKPLPVIAPSGRYLGEGFSWQTPSEMMGMPAVLREAAARAKQEKDTE
jgi:hypothetical protein